MSANTEESAVPPHGPSGGATLHAVAAWRAGVNNPSQGAAATDVVPALCANCGAPVASHYCGECGQRLDHAVHSLWHFILEVAEDLTHADSRLWRTMGALVFKPGYLTNEFLAGRRMRYLPPFRLYLVSSVLFFLLAGVLDRHAGIWIIKVNGSDHVKIEPAPKAVARSGETAQQVGEKMCEQMADEDRESSWLLPALQNACRKSVADGGRGIQEVFTHNIPRGIFIALPILGLVMMPLYRNPRRYYIEHLLFFLHAHAFLFLLLGLFAIAATILRAGVLVSALGLAVTFIIPYYYFNAMRRVYGQGCGRTLGKLLVLSLAYLLIGLLILVATSVYSVLAQ